MEAEIVKGAIGDKGAYDVAFKAGKLVAKIDANLGVCSAGVVIEVSIDDVIDAIKAAIPGQIDDAVLDLLKAALAK